jgi:hypothetical protein
MRGQAPIPHIYGLAAHGRSPRPLDGLNECERELCGEDRREKSLIQSKRNNGTGQRTAKSRRAYESLMRPLTAMSLRDPRTF